MNSSVAAESISSTSDLRIVFAGTPDFAAVALERLVSSDLSPRAVLTQPDRRAGRGRKMQASPVKLAAMGAGIVVHQPLSLKNEEAHCWLASQRPDLLIVVAYGLILPTEILQIPRFGCWNIHASLLPRWRGAAPIQRAIEAGDDETGVCIMQMDEGLDTGAVLARKSTPIAADETAGSLHDRLAEMGSESLLHCIHQLASGKSLESKAQTDEGASYAAKLVKAEAQLNWQMTAEALQRKVRAFNPWPVAWCDIAGERTRIWSAQVLADVADKMPGEIVGAGKQGIDIATANGQLRIVELQRPGGRRISAAEYFNARIAALESMSNS
jgi:methionyl-tRNA formyltransferase